jgi:hypothetical protein
MNSKRQERIRERAYRLWQEEGEPHGRDLDHWDRATYETPEEDENAGTRADQRAFEAEEKLGTGSAPETSERRAGAGVGLGTATGGREAGGPVETPNAASGSARRDDTAPARRAG